MSTHKDDYQPNFARCNQLAIDAINLGSNTLVRLEEQREQVSRIQKTREAIDAHLVHTKHHISATRSWLYALFHSAPRQPRAGRSTASESVPDHMASSPAAPPAVSIKRATASPLGQARALEDLQTNVTTLRSVAEKLGEALDESNQQLAELTEDLTITRSVIDYQTRDIKRLLH